MKQPYEMRDLADQAQAENESGVIAGEEAARRYLDGVEQALRWAVGDGSTSELDQLLDRMRRAQAAPVTELLARVHKAEPTGDDHTCVVCGDTELRRVPGGSGPVWVHRDGHVAAASPVAGA